MMLDANEKSDAAQSDLEMSADMASVAAEPTATDKTVGEPASLRWEPVPVEQVVVPGGRRMIDPQHVAALKASFARLGGQLQLQPIVVDGEFILIDGAHRLEAAKRSNWSHIAAMVISGVEQVDRGLLQAEANRVRRSLSVPDLEEAWRTHYEPELRAAAKRRRFAALRRCLPASSRSCDAQGGAPVDSTKPVIGISNNEEEEPGESLARAAKRITGLSLDTLKKVAQIRELATTALAPAELRAAAEIGLAKLSAKTVSVESVYRALHNLQRRAEDAAGSAEAESLLADEAALERVLSDASVLAEHFDGALSAQVFAAAQRSGANREMLRAVRGSLTHSLATVVALECNLEPDPGRALGRIGAEVSQRLSSTTRSRMRGVVPVARDNPRPRSPAGKMDEPAAARAEQLADERAAA